MDVNTQCTPTELEEVMQRYGTEVYRLAYSRLRSVMDAEDVYQEVFLRYFRKRPPFDSEEHRKAWLLRVTINRAKSHATSAWMRHTVAMDVQIPFREPEEQELDMALSKLRPDDRMLLHLFYYEELSAREICALLNRKESTVRTQLTRARKRLGTILKGEENYESALSEHE
jgi:RNA polymerase sigma-70 factor (ECF subfamily)